MNEEKQEKQEKKSSRKWMNVMLTQTVHYIDDERYNGVISKHEE